MDIKPTGTCEFWVQEIALVKHNQEPSSSHDLTGETPNNNTPFIPPSITLPEIYKSRVACIYNTDGKCGGMITPQRFEILFQAFQRSKAEGLHDSIRPAPASFASEVLGLLARKNKLEDKYHSKKIKDSFSGKLPAHIRAAFQKWDQVTQEKMASPLDFDPEYHHYLSSDPRDIISGAHHDSLSSRFSGMSICHPIYDEKAMKSGLRHAIYSAQLS